VFICLWTRTPYTPLTHCICVQYIRKRGGGRDEPERRLEGQQFKKLSWVENTNMTGCTYLQAINSDKHLPLFLYRLNF
jgi:hypothetical protein